MSRRRAHRPAKRAVHAPTGRVFYRVGRVDWAEVAYQALIRLSVIVIVSFVLAVYLSGESFRW